MLSDFTLLEYSAKYGTPLFVYDGDMVLEKYYDLFKFIPHPRLKVHYALKANYNPGIMKLLLEAGANIDAVSPGEVEYALRLGFPADRIIYTANNMTDEEFDQVMRHDVLINIGSLSRLKKMAAKYPNSKVCLRFNPDVTDGDNVMTMTGGDLTKFGILLDSVEEVKEIVKSGSLHVVGLHEHTGSGLQHAESVYQAMQNLMAIATKENFPELEFMDFGGGFKVPYQPNEKTVDYVAMGAEITRLFTEFEKSYGKELVIRFEPGKYIAAQCGTLLTQVNTIKHNRTRTIAGCNSGFPQLIRPVLYGAYHIIDNLSNPNGKLEVYDICGNICETGDRFAEQRQLPEIREYDILAIRNAGAYCYSMGSVYNLRSMPGEIVVSKGDIVSLKKRKNDSQLVDSILEDCQF